MASSKIKRIGPGVKVIKGRLKNPGKVAVGIIDAGKHAESDMTVASIGYVHEFGSSDGRIPERSFMRSTVKEKRKEVNALNRKLLIAVQTGKYSFSKALGILGSFVADAISRKIVTLKQPPNALSTILAKGSSNPLVDTGQLKNSITWKVENE